MFLVKTDSNGNAQWNLTYGGTKDDWANSLIQASDSGYVLAGYTNSDVENQSTWIVKVDSLGNMQWSKENKTNDAYFVKSDSTLTMEDNIDCYRTDI